MSDDKFELSRRKILGATAAVGVAGAGAGVGTSALFSDEESFEDNQIQAGELDLFIDYTTSVDQDGVETGGTPEDGSPNTGTIQGGESGQYQIADVKPGDSGFLAFCPKIVDNKGWLFVGSAEGVTDYENGQTEPEEDVDPSGGGSLGSSQSGQGAGELSEAIQVDVKYCEPNTDDPQGPDDYDTIHEFNNPDDYTLADLFKELESGFLLDGEPNGASGTQEYPSSPDQNTQSGPCLCINWEVPIEVGNEIQSDSVEFDITFAARQWRNNPDPENPVADATVYPGDSIQNAIDSASGGDVISVFGGSFGDGSDYAEELDVDTSVTLARASGEQPTIAADAQNDNRAVTVTASDVTLDGLDVTFTGGAGTSSNAEKYGIEVQGGSDNFTLCNSTVRGVITEQTAPSQNATRSTGVVMRAPNSSVSSPTVRHNTFTNIKCVGSTENNNTLDSDSKAKGVALNGLVDNAVVSGNEITEIGAASGDDPNVAEFTYDAGGIEGTDKPRGISIVEAGASRAPENFVIENNVLGGTGSDAIAGVYGQPAIFIGGSGGMGLDHDVRGNHIYHPLDNLNGAEPLNLNGENTYYDTSGNTQSPSLVSADADEDGGNLIDRAGGSNYAGQP